MARKIYAAGGVGAGEIGSVASGVGSLFQMGSQYNGYKLINPGGQSSYALTGTGKNRAGSVSGSYTDLQKYMSAAPKYKRTGWGKTAETIGLILSAVGGSVGSFGSGEKQKNDELNNSLTSNGKLNTPLLGDTGTKMSENSLTSKGLDVTGITKDTPAPSLLNPDVKTGVTPFITDSSSLIKPTDNTFDSLLGNKDIVQTEATLASGGKNKSGATPVEAEGGEIEISFDDNHNIISSKPIIGASHSQGGVDMKLPKNHAILNKEQQARLKNGESLKSILDSIPNVNSGKAVRGLINPDDPPTFTQSQLDYIEHDRLAKEKAGKIMNDRWIKNLGSGRQLPKMTTMGDISLGLDAPEKSNVPLEKGLENVFTITKPDESQPEQVDNSLLNPSTGTYNKPATFEDAPVDTKSTWDEISTSGGFFPTAEAPQSISAQSLANPADPSTPPPPDKFKWGYPESRAAADVGANLISLFQPRAKGITVPNAHVGSPTMVTPRYQNPKATLDEVGRQIKAGMKQLTETGRSDMIPSLIASGMEMTNKVGEQYAGLNSENESKAQGENARASNQFSLTQSGMDADNLAKNAQIELETLRQQGLQDSERAKSLMNLLSVPANYDKLKQDQKIRNAVYARMLTEMYMKH